ncbi:MAG TPA: MFS transporter, partial [Ktedonobacteraceae bacterium]|nr:MFS transporter [Ktedonobacteraceae bacterium]
VLMAVGLVVLVLVPIWPYMLLSACIFGAGFGIYLAADLALAIAVLPRQEDSGKDLGLLNMTIFLSLIISPLLGGAIIAMTHSYVLLFGLAALSCAGAAGMIVPIKTVR